MSSGEELNFMSSGEEFPLYNNNMIIIHLLQTRGPYRRYNQP